MKFYGAVSGGHCVPTHLPLFNRQIDDVRAVLLAQDVIYVGGGNTVNLLAVWRAHGIDRVLREAWEKGVVLAGLCAGSMCWFEGGVTASFGTTIAPLHEGLGLVGRPASGRRRGGTPGTRRSAVGAAASPVDQLPRGSTSGGR